jgi:hypothetical protein
MEVSGVAVSVGFEIDGSAFGVIAEYAEAVSIPLDNAGIAVPVGQAQISCTVYDAPAAAAAWVVAVDIEPESTFVHVTVLEDVIFAQN